jgi:hypothetical protein
MHRLHGQCHCGDISVELELTAAPSSYQPRACDCDFCRRHGAAYLSDPEGSMVVATRVQNRGEWYRQGSGTAEFLLCPRCGVLVGAFYRDGERLLGVANIRALDDAAALGPPQTVSPKTLSAVQKAERWRTIWFQQVRIGA